MRALGFLAYLGERFLERISKEELFFYERRVARQDAARLRELCAMDADEVRKEGDIGSLMLARQIELAKQISDG